MKSRDFLRIHQVEEAISPFRNVIDVPRPQRGWVRAIQEALGITNVQLAKLLKLKPQTIEGMQKHEVTGSIKLKTLERLAEALGCRLVYAIVPSKPIDEIRRDRAHTIARRRLQHVSHSMKLEDQGVGNMAEERAIDRLVEELLAANPKRLWE